jgi:hypothetical protein
LPVSVWPSFDVSVDVAVLVSTLRSVEWSTPVSVVVINDVTKFANVEKSFDVKLKKPKAFDVEVEYAVSFWVSMSVLGPLWSSVEPSIRVASFVLESTWVPVELVVSRSVDESKPWAFPWSVVVLVSTTIPESDSLSPLRSGAPSAPCSVSVDAEVSLLVIVS